MFTGIIQGQAIVENKFIDSNTFSIKTDLNLSLCIQDGNLIPKAYQISIFPILPSVTWNFNF